MTRNLLAVTLVLLGTSAASAQVTTFTYPGGFVPRAHVVPVPAYGYGYGYYPSTAYESYRRGDAALIRARGDAFEAVSRGNINNGIATEQAIRNRKLAIETRHELRNSFKRLQAEEFAKKRQVRENYLAKKTPQTPQVLTDYDLDRQTGEVQWPKGLQAPQFTRTRQIIEEMLELWAQGLSYPNLNADLRSTTEGFQKELKANARKMKANEYLEAKRFLEKLSVL